MVVGRTARAEWSGVGIVGSVTGQDDQFGAGDHIGDAAWARGLGRAASFVRLASVRLSERARLVGVGLSGDEDAVALMRAGSTQVRLDQVLSLLEDGCGAVPDADLLEDGLAGVGPGGASDPMELLAAADQEFDRVPPGPVPLRLPSARAELAGAIVSLMPEDNLE